jgi:hypothetical protein
MATNQLLPFGMGESPNRIPFEDWNTLPSRLTGFQSGIASSQQFNYILAQGGVAGYILAQLIVEQLAQDATLESADTLFTNFKSALAKFIPTGIADKSIATAKLADLAVTAAKLASNSVQTAKIVDKAVTTAKLADSAVTVTQLADQAVTAAKILSGTITFDRLASAAIATKEEAEAGTSQVKLMTPLAVAQAIAALIPAAVPTGMILPFLGTSVPEGYLLCNGSNVSRTTYANLFNVIGTKCGAGDGSTTFTLPNLHRRFAEYTTTTSEVGKTVEAGLPNITGRFNRDGRQNGPTYGIITKENLSTGPFYASDDVGRGCAGSEAIMAGDLMFDASRSSSFFGLSTTVQPASLRLLPCIKT